MKQKLTLRDYQIADIEAIEEAWKNNRSVLYQLPTGGGKSVVLSQIISDYRDEKILIFAHKRRLLTQIREHLAKVGVKTGLLVAQREENLDANVVIVSIRTAVKSKRLETLTARHWDRVIIDEARHSRTGSYDTVLDELLKVHPTHKLLGVDATPYRKDGKRLDKHFQYMAVSQENVKSLQDRGFLAKHVTYATPIGEIEAQVKEVANDYQQTDLSNYMRQDAYLDHVINAYTKFGQKRQAIVFAVDKAHAKDLRDRFIQQGHKSVVQIDSDMSQEEIDKVFDDYENKKIDILINIEMLTEGVDLPETGCIIGARPTKSLTLYLQMAGRGMRPKSDGSELIIIDCAGWTEEFGSISSPKQWSLDPEVDPNNPRKEMRVVGVIEKGKKYTEDISDFIGEVVEMTPEEYIAHIEGGLESAEKTNLSIDEKITNLLNRLVEYMLGVIDDPAFETLQTYIDIDSKKYLIYLYVPEGVKRQRDRFETYDLIGLKMTIHETWPVFVEFWNVETGCDYYSSREYNQTRFDLYMRYSTLLGILNQHLAQHKGMRKEVLNIKTQIFDLQKQKLNLEVYREAAKKLEEERFVLAVHQHAEAGKTFELLREVRVDQFFKGGYWSEYLYKIEIPAKQVNGWINKIVLHIRRGRSSSNDNVYKMEKTVKEDRLLEILRSGDWKPAEWKQKEDKMVQVN